MQRKTRSGRRFNVHGYEKRKMTTEKVTHFILFPVVVSSIGKCNDFYFHSLSLCWNDKNLWKDSRSKHMLHGFYLEDELNINDLDKSSEKDWFSSTKSNDLVNIGKIAGYFIRCNACSVALALDENFISEQYSPIGTKEFNDVVNALKDEKTIVPVIIKLEISPDSSFNYSRFICLSEDFVNNLVDGEEVVVTRRVKLLKIKLELHEWAWRVLNISTFEGRQKLIKEVTLRAVTENENQVILCDVTENENQVIMCDVTEKQNQVILCDVTENENQVIMCDVTEKQNQATLTDSTEKENPVTLTDLIEKKNQDHTCSSRRKYPSKRYPSEMFVTF